MRYAAAIESAMIERLKADRGFAGLLTKNPLHPHWQNEFWTFSVSYHTQRRWKT
ncbi:replication initiation protein [Vibrio thalassae]|uniref:replication initiation protein n=1 Tax=Vibrio thalassae TaxID=1243014 RepID=UPI003F9BBD18